MSTKRTGFPEIDALLRIGKNRVEFVDVPEMGYLVIEGDGPPSSPAFSAALPALFSISYAAHFAVKKLTGEAPRVMPLEALWWFDGIDADTQARMFAGAAATAEVAPEQWHWQAMIMQLPPIDDVIVEEVMEAAAAKNDLPALADLRYRPWCEGPAAQILHIGPYESEGPTVARLFEAIHDAGLQLAGHHHEIYLGDPRRSAPDKLRTIIRHPVRQPA